MICDICGREKADGIAMCWQRGNEICLALGYDRLEKENAALRARCEAAEDERARWEARCASLETFNMEQSDLIASLRARCEDLEKERLSLLQQCRVQGTGWSLEQSRASALEAALRKYGDHTFECRNELHDDEGPCGCGWDCVFAALAGKESGK